MKLTYFVIFAVTFFGYLQALPSCPDYTPAIVFYPDSEDCGKYYECYSGILTRMSCPAHLYWNTVANACDYAVNVNCGDRPIPSPASSTSSSTTAAVTSPSPTTPNYDPDPKCPASTENIEFYPDPSNCKHYFECNKGERFIIVCPNELLYNVKVKACDYPENVDCSGRSTSVIPSPSTTPTSPPTTSSVAPTYNPNPQCPASTQNIVFYPDPYNCQQYFECNKGNRFTIVCPADLLYNVKVEACDYAENVDCTGRSTGITQPSTTPTTQPTTPPTTQPTIPPTTQSTTPSITSSVAPTFDPNPECPASAKDIVFYPDPSSCKQFFECNLGTRFTLVCPKDLLYNVNVAACDYPENVDCTGRSTPVTPPSTTPSGPSGPCADKKDGEYAGDPKDCTKFYECLGGAGESRPCGPNLFWCQEELTCDYLNKPGCSCYTE